jgi:hypothetical protein
MRISLPEEARERNANQEFLSPLFCVYFLYWLKCCVYSEELFDSLQTLVSTRPPRGEPSKPQDAGLTGCKRFQAAVCLCFSFALGLI